MPDDNAPDPADHPSAAGHETTNHSAEIKDAAAKPADSGDDVGPSAQR